MSPRAEPVALPCSTRSGFSQPSVEKGTIPASSQASPTSGMRRTSSSQASHRIGTSSIQGRCSSWSWSRPPVARSSSSAREPITFSLPHEQG